MTQQLSREDMLPPMPESVGTRAWGRPEQAALHTAEQMRSYGLACYERGLEDAEKACAKVADQYGGANGGHSAERCVNAIKALGEKA